MSSKVQPDIKHVGVIQGTYAIAYATFRDLLRNTYGPSARSMASALVCVSILAVCWNIFVVLDSERAYLIVKNSINLLLLCSIVICVAVDLAFVQNGNADKWADLAQARWRLSKRSRVLICVVLVGVAASSFLLSTLLLD